MTVYVVISLPKIHYIYVYMVLANPMLNLFMMLKLFTQLEKHSCQEWFQLL